MAETPTPWIVLPLFPEVVVPACDAGKKYGMSTNLEADKRDYAQVIARCIDDRHGRGNAVSHAALIVRAVNGHAKLRAALEGMIGPLEYAYGGVSSPTADRVKNEIIPAARRALEES